MPSMPMPQGMTQEAIQYVTEMIRLNLAFHDNDTLRGEMDSREQLQLKKMKGMIDGEVGSVKQVTETLAVATDLALKQLTSEASGSMETLTKADASLRIGSEGFRVKGNELDARVNDGFATIEEAIKEMRIAGSAQVATGDVALARFDTLVAQAKITHDSNSKDIVDKIKEMESRGSGPAAGGAGQAASAGESRQDPWFGQSLGAAHRDGRVPAGAREQSGVAPARQSMGLCHRRDFEITKLPSTVQREDFIVWRDQLEELL